MKSYPVSDEVEGKMIPLWNNCVFALLCLCLSCV